MKTLYVLAAVTVAAAIGGCTVYQPAPVAPVAYVAPAATTTYVAPAPAIVVR
jgi:hypothetical protein